MKTPHKPRTSTKINRHERIVQILLSGKPVSPQEILSCLKGTDQEKVGYRLSTNIYNARLDGAIIKVYKTGRNVTGYQLINVDEFNANGRYVGKQTTPATPTKTIKEVKNETIETEITN